MNWIQGSCNAYDLPIAMDTILPVLDDLEEFLKIDNETIEERLGERFGDDVEFLRNNFDILQSDLISRFPDGGNSESVPVPPPQQQSQPTTSIDSLFPLSDSIMMTSNQMSAAPLTSSSSFSFPQPSPSQSVYAPFQQSQPSLYQYPPPPPPPLSMTKQEPVYSASDMFHFPSSCKQSLFLLYSFSLLSIIVDANQMVSAPLSAPPMQSVPTSANSVMSSGQQPNYHFQYPPMQTMTPPTPPSAIPPFSPLLPRRGHYGSLSSLGKKKKDSFLPYNNNILFFILVESGSASSSAYTTDDEEFFVDPLNPPLQNIPTIAFDGKESNGGANHPQLRNIGPGLIAIPINPKTGKPKRKRRKKIRSAIIPPPLLPNRGANCSLWEFFLELLADPFHYDKLIKWTNRDEGEFKIIDSEVVSVIWGLLKNKSTMKYDHMSRSIRYYYGKDILDKVPDKQLVYRFGSNSNWLSYQPKSQGLDQSRMPAAPIEICGRVAKPKLYAVAKINSPLA